MIRRLMCAVLGHRWRKISVNPRKADNLGHLHPLAGYKAECRRCHKVWDDLESPFFVGDPVVPYPQEPPVARIVKR